MLINYLKLSFRLLARSPFFTFINVAGLSIGFAVFFILWPFTQSELQSDTFIKDHERIARPILDFRWTDNAGESWGHLNITAVPSHIGTEMLTHNAVEDITRSRSQQGSVVTVEEPGKSPFTTKIDKGIIADKNFFEFFNLPFIYGTPGDALAKADAVVLSQRLSFSLFGKEDPVGKLLKINNKTFLVTAVFRDIPRNSHLQFEMAFSNVADLALWNASRGNFWVQEYFKMKGDPSELANILNANKERFIGYYLNKNPHIKIDFTSQPLSEIAYSVGYSGDDFKPKSKLMLTVLGGVSIVVLIMAWMNYVNLTVSRTKSRFKEMAVRRVSGALLPDLFLQLICQSAVINVLAALIGLTIIQVVRLPFDRLLRIYISSPLEMEMNILLFFLGTFFLGIVATAAYPTWITVRHSTRQLLTKNTPAQKQWLTTVLTTSQYVAALSLIAWILVMNSQLEYILNKDIGVDRENVLIFEAPDIGLEENGNQKMKEFAIRIHQEVKATSVSLCGRVNGEIPYSMELRRPGSDIFFGIDSPGCVDENFIPLYNIPLIAGRNFLKDESSKSIIVSRYAAERLGYHDPNETIGAIIEGNTDKGWARLEVIGVIEDYRTKPYLMEEGSTESITGRGICLTYLNSVWSTAIPQRISIKLETSKADGLVAQIEQMYNQTFPGNIFKWYFLDENINRQYGDQKIARNQVTFFTALALAIACLGLLGMISNKVAEKLKEISVRKILGAGHRHILALLVSSTSVQIGISLVIGVPIAWKFSQEYLEKYTDHIALQWWHFALPVLILVGIMFATIALVLWKAARNNPLEALKQE